MVSPKQFVESPCGLLTPTVSIDTVGQECLFFVTARPTHKELTAKIKAARAALAAGDVAAAAPSKLAANFSELNCYSAEEQKEAIHAALSEVAPRHYVGSSPPARSFEQTTLNLELFIFIWDSPYFKARMYLKFCLTGSDEFEDVALYMHSLHLNRPKVAGRKKK